MLILGDPDWKRPDGNTCELRFLVDDLTVAVVHGNLFSKWNVVKSATGTDTFVATLSGNKQSAFGSLPQEGKISFWVQVPPGPQMRLWNGQIDYFAIRADRELDVIGAEIHGRGPLAPLIDRRWNLSFAGDLSDLLREAGGNTPPIEVQGLPPRRVLAYVNARSAYGALRMLGASLGFLVKEADDGVAVICQSILHARDEFRAKPITAIEGDDILSATVTRGAPVKKREGR